MGQGNPSSFVAGSQSDPLMDDLSYYQQLAQALAGLGRMGDSRQRMHVAFPMFTECIEVLQSHPQRDNKAWAITLSGAA